MRIFIVSLLVMALVGCTTTSRSIHSQSKASRTYPSMIIRSSDIDSSTEVSPKQVSPAVTKVPVIRHTVRAGETLWAISKLYGVDVAAVANANSLNDSKSIEIGQILVIPGASSRRAPVKRANKVNYGARRSSTFIWPVNGDIASSFGSRVDKSVNKGIDIRAGEGMDVAASRGGKVVYCDSRLKGFGQTVIIDHMDGFQTVYSYNESIVVKIGDIVEQRDVIAKVGSSGRASEPMLHFEIRKNGEPQNPKFYLSR